MRRLHPDKCRKILKLHGIEVDGKNEIVVNADALIAAIQTAFLCGLDMEVMKVTTKERSAKP